MRCFAICLQYWVYESYFPEHITVGTSHTPRHVLDTCGQWLAQLQFSVRPGELDSPTLCHEMTPSRDFVHLSHVNYLGIFSQILSFPLSSHRLLFQMILCYIFHSHLLVTTEQFSLHFSVTLNYPGQICNSSLLRAISFYLNLASKLMAISIYKEHI